MPHQDTTRTLKQVAGDTAEDLAAQHLVKAGLRILTRNFRVRGGEIDCIALDGQTLVFVEVRLRRHTGFGGAAASIDSRKQQRIIHAARCYLQRYPRQADRPCRFDCVLLNTLDANQLEWIKDAFQTL
jgi:putative endonuclease